MLNELWINGNGLENLQGLEYLPLLEVIMIILNF